jgi:hypothetical protein
MESCQQVVLLVVAVSLLHPEELGDASQGLEAEEEDALSVGF